MGKKSEAFKRGVEESLVELLKETFKENLISVMIYGSYVSGNFVKGVSDINVLIILKNPLTEQMLLLGKKIRRPIRRYRITPLILTQTEFINSADVFPMEYSDITERNKVIYGSDETKTLTLKRKNLRHQLEDRLRGNVTSLRQAVVASSGKKRVLTNYLKIWFGSINALFRGLLRLKRIDTVPFTSGELFERMEKSFGIDTEPLRTLIELRSGKRRIDVEELTYRILGFLQELIKIVDTMAFKEE